MINTNEILNNVLVNKVEVIFLRQQFFYNIMNLRKLLTENPGPRLLRKQRSDFINTRYFTSHESTSYSGQSNNFRNQISSISLKDCLDQINVHIVEQRPLRPIFAVQIKKFLNQLKRIQRDNTGDQEDKTQFKDYTVDQKLMISSPYMANRSLKKVKQNFVEKSTTQIVRRTLKKRKINFENGEAQIVTRTKKTFQKSQRKIAEKASQMKQFFASINEQVKLLKGQLLSQIQDLKQFFSFQVQKITQITSKMVRNCIIEMNSIFCQRQSQLSQTIRDLEQRIKEGQSRQRTLKDYLKNRETQMITFWNALNLRPY